MVIDVNKNRYKLLEERQNMYKPKRVTRSFSAVVIIGLTLAITGGIIPVSISTQQ